MSPKIFSEINKKYLQVPGFKVNQLNNKKAFKYCVIIPVINEGERIKKQIIQMKKFTKIIDIIVVDGGSNDNSTDLTFLRKNNIKARIDTPIGQSVQLRAGFYWALKKGYGGIITIDGNNKDDNGSLPSFVDALNEEFDYVQASRFIKGGIHKNTPKERIVFNRYLISPLLSMSSGKWYTDTPNAFRAYSRKYLLHPKVKPFRKIFKRYELLFYLTTRANRLGLKTKEIATKRVYPKDHIPTKIVGIKKILDLINIFRIALGIYNP